MFDQVARASLPFTPVLPMPPGKSEPLPSKAFASYLGLVVKAGAPHRSPLGELGTTQSDGVGARHGGKLGTSLGSGRHGAALSDRLVLVGRCCLNVCLNISLQLQGSEVVG